MSTVLDVPAADAGAAAGWRRWRGLVALGVGVVAVLLLLALLGPRTSEEALAPDSVAPDGARAVARVLAEQGVEVTEARSFAGATRALEGARARGATVLVTQPDLLSAARLRTLSASGADLVLLRPGDAALAALTPDVRRAGSAAAGDRAPGCEVADPAAAGTARAGGPTYAGTGDARTCYGGSYARMERSGAGPLTVLGQPALLTNRWADREGNGTLALRTLGAQPELVWYLPDPLDTDSPTVPLLDLVPRWFLPAVALVLLSAVVAVLWRGRRLGRLVEEPLPVVVRAAETVEGHGRLYASAGASGRAADELRRATLRRLRGWVGLDPRAPVQDVADQVAWLTGRPAPAVRELLAGTSPRDDPALVRLALELDTLEDDVRGTPSRRLDAGQ
ncbi:hypothetical protein FHR75_002988 [Kineococcus radiotolerans]|uniref:DUF4350 domain-containing protein n=1 Tax=Kineococcus radiotolerans TaxID=131568 RepID=A0A7W4TP79_KINRA|nr:DUF4350 domain-containing protein [Kineococcus radiotolerans]MBB2902157.1 hypothetical protein [Kineococcus radiotolerans]